MVLGEICWGQPMPTLSDYAFGGLVFAVAILPIPDANAQGRFIGPLQIEMDAPGRTGTLLAEFAYEDPAGRKWKVPKGHKVDGASIPQALWSILGGPWDGPYRRASVIHDYYCETKDRGWRNVHHVFYDAMLTDGVGPIKAKTMYAGVLYFGPRWKTEYGIAGKPTLKVVQPEFDEAKLKQLEQWVEANDPSLEEIDGLVQ
jgi:hypothetical protein